MLQVVHDDGDEEDLEEGEAAEAVEAFDVRAMEHEDWREAGHPLLGKRVLRTFGKCRTFGHITKWLPADGVEPALFRVVHDDGDEEDLEEGEAAEALEAAATVPERRTCGRFQRS